MLLFFVGLGLFVLGAVLNAVGWRWHARSIHAASDEFMAWLLTVIKEWFGMLTGPNHTSGERLAAGGAILSALGLVLAAAGIVVWST